MVAAALAAILTPQPAADKAVAVALRCRDEVVDAERRFLTRRWKDVLELPMTENTATEAQYMAALPNKTLAKRGVVLVTSVSHAYRALATFARAMPSTRFYVATVRPPNLFQLADEFEAEAAKCAAYAAKGDVMDDYELLMYLAWRDA